MINRINTFDPQPDPKEQKHWLLTSRPCVMPLGRPIIHVSMRSSENLSLIQYAIGSNRNRKAAFGKLVLFRQMNQLEARKEKTMNLIAPAATLGPNHCPTSVPSSLPARAIRWTLNGVSGAGVSRNHIRICIHMLHNPPFGLMWGTPPVWKRD